MQRYLEGEMENVKSEVEGCSRIVVQNDNHDQRDEILDA